MLGRKQTSKNEDFQAAWFNIANLVSLSEIRELVIKTAQEIRNQCYGKRVGFGWSGGKDSQALLAVMQVAELDEIYPACLAVTANLEFTTFLEWLAKLKLSQKPANLYHMETGHNLQWLEENPAMLFPQEYANKYKWMMLRQQFAQDKLIAEQNLDMIILGRRKLDGNNVPHGTTNNISIRKDDGVARYCPLADWTHEQVMAACFYYDMPLPPCYQWSRGWLEGPSIWPARNILPTLKESWQDVFNIEPAIVRHAGHYFYEAFQIILETENAERAARCASGEVEEPPF